MATLQRSTKSFRRQGSSGLVWDDKLLLENMNTQKVDHSELRHCQTITGGIGMMNHGGSNGGAPPPSILARSLSTQAANLRSLKAFGSRFVGGNGKTSTTMKSKSKNQG